MLGAALLPILASSPAAAGAGDPPQDPARPSPIAAVTPAPAPADGAEVPRPIAATPAGSAATDIDAEATGEALPQPFRIGAQPAWFLLGGLSSGYTAMGDTGGYLGGEVSLARLREGKLLGLYADAYYDFGADGTYVSAGPELGWKLLALDGGVAGRFTEDRDLGVTARLCVGAGLFSLCGRYTRFFSADAHEDVLQFGALLKLPLMSPSGGYR
jgi:hypothetical protein